VGTPKELLAFFMECIILAGGFGTHLQSVVNDRPKCLAPIVGTPFLEYLLIYLEKQGVEHVVLSLGYKHELVEEWLLEYRCGLHITTVIENDPLGTGGAIKLAMQQTSGTSVFVVNGDTFFPVQLDQLLYSHQKSGFKTTLGLKLLHHFDRYGSVELKGQCITAFHEKQFCERGFINGGVYLLQRDVLDHLPEKFSFEKDFLEKEIYHNTIGGYVEDAYFIDIGVPEDYKKAQKELRGIGNRIN
jgi:D-glycero-alpha-D-manno-heptose 1-phosphate guanylyltransferase